MLPSVLGSLVKGRIPSWLDSHSYTDRSHRLPHPVSVPKRKSADQNNTPLQVWVLQSVRWGCVSETTTSILDSVAAPSGSIT